MSINYTNYYSNNGYWSYEFKNNAYLTLGAQTQFSFGTGDFTIEFFYYPTNSQPNINYLIDFRTANGLFPSLYVDTNYKVVYYTNTGARITSTKLLDTNIWYHISLVRISGTTTLYINGLREGVAYSDTNNYSVGANRPVIGTNGTSVNSNNLNGRISNLRIVKGTGVYTSNTTVPTVALTNITNTSLLTCHANTILDSSSYAITPTNTNISIIETSPFSSPTFSGVERTFSSILKSNTLIFNSTSYNNTTSNNLLFSIDYNLTDTILLQKNTQANTSTINKNDSWTTQSNKVIFIQPKQYWS
jgi:hypothetical protein